jgi:tetratricopeptide (TPR) repeat protein
LNLETIEAGFAEWEKYDYIKVFAENAYAYIKAKQGKYEEALTLCTKGNARMQHVYGKQRFALHQSILIYNTSQIYELVKSYDRAEAQLRLAISYDPYYGEYYNDLGNILSRLPGRAKEALDAYSTAIDLCPPYYEAHLNRGMLRAALGDDLSALRDFNRALEIKPVEWRAFLEIGNLHLSRGACEQALQAYQKASAIEWRNADLECNMGFAHSECGNQQAAISHYREAIALDRGHAGAHNNLAIALFESGEMIEALRQATIAAEIGGDPDYEENRRSLEIALKGITPDTVPQQ